MGPACSWVHSLTLRACVKTHNVHLLCVHDSSRKAVCQGEIRTYQCRSPQHPNTKTHKSIMREFLTSPGRGGFWNAAQASCSSSQPCTVLRCRQYLHWAPHRLLVGHSPCCRSSAADEDVTAQNNGAVSTSPSRFLLGRCAFSYPGIFAFAL